MTKPDVQVTDSQTPRTRHPDQRFRQNRRLADKYAVSRVFKKPLRSCDNMFTVLYRPSGRNMPRLGLAIGKKNCRRSTGRNRLKRIVRESFRRHLALLGGVDIVVMNRAPATTADNKALYDSLARHWQRCRAGGTHRAGKH